MSPKKNPAAVALGKLGRAANTEAQKEAARTNGTKGGRPRAPQWIVVGIRKNLAPKKDYVWVLEAANGRTVHFDTIEAAQVEADAANRDTSAAIYGARPVLVP